MPFRSLILIVLIIAASLFAHSRPKEALINYYTFEHKGRSTFGSVTLQEGYKSIPINLPWFEWKCTATRQTDGIVVLCNRGDDAVESKVFCALAATKQVRAVQIKKGQNFVSLEVLCKPEVEIDMRKKPKPSEPMVCMPASQAEQLKQNQNQNQQSPPIDSQQPPQSLPVEAPPAEISPGSSQQQLPPPPAMPQPPALPPPSSGVLPAPEPMVTSPQGR